MVVTYHEKTHAEDADQDDLLFQRQGRAEQKRKRNAEHERI